jgi:hypothetical protein
MRASILWGSGSWLGPGISEFFGPQMELAYRLVPISQGPKNSGIPGPNIRFYFYVGHYYHLISCHTTNDSSQYRETVSSACPFIAPIAYQLCIPYPIIQNSIRHLEEENLSEICTGV